MHWEMTVQPGTMSQTSASTAHSPEVAQTKQSSQDDSSTHVTAPVEVDAPLPEEPEPDDEASGEVPSELLVDSGGDTVDAPALLAELDPALVELPSASGTHCPATPVAAASPYRRPEPHPESGKLQYSLASHWPSPPHWSSLTH